jgi:Mg2+ and Co2+ transporter CorA
MSERSRAVDAETEEIAKRVYQQEAKRMTEGDDPRTPTLEPPLAAEDSYLGVTVKRTMPKTMAQQISELSKQVSEAASMLQSAREACDTARVQVEKAQTIYVAGASELHRLLIEHGEGTPEGKPYPR